MRLLLDTHILLWWSLGNRLLTPRARAMIEDRGNEIAVSIASVWESSIKSRLGRRSENMVSATEFAELVAENNFALVPILLRHSVEVERLPLAHGDPFDRLLVATAYADTYRFLTHDRALAAYGDQVIVV